MPLGRPNGRSTFNRNLARAAGRPLGRPNCCRASCCACRPIGRSIGLLFWLHIHCILAPFGLWSLHYLFWWVKKLFHQAFISSLPTLCLGVQIDAHNPRISTPAALVPLHYGAHFFPTRVHLSLLCPTLFLLQTNFLNPMALVRLSYLSEVLLHCSLVSFTWWTTWSPTMFHTSHNTNPSQQMVPPFWCLESVDSFTLSDTIRVGSLHGVIDRPSLLVSLDHFTTILNVEIQLNKRNLFLHVTRMLPSQDSQ